MKTGSGAEARRYQNSAALLLLPDRWLTTAKNAWGKERPEVLERMLQDSRDVMALSA